MLIDPSEPKTSFIVSFSQDFREDLAGAGVESLGTRLKSREIMALLKSHCQYYQTHRKVGAS